MCEGAKSIIDVPNARSFPQPVLLDSPHLPDPPPSPRAKVLSLLRTLPPRPKPLKMHNLIRKLNVFVPPPLRREVVLPRLLPQRVLYIFLAREAGFVVVYVGTAAAAVCVARALARVFACSLGGARCGADVKIGMLGLAAGDLHGPFGEWVVGS